MTDRIEALEKLQRLRESGALSDEEFEREKAALFAPRTERETVRVAAPARGGVPLWAWIAGAGALLLIMIVAVVLLTRGGGGATFDAEVNVAAPAADAPAANLVQPEPEPPIRGRPAAEQLAAAFRAAFRGQPVRDAEDGEFTYRPGRLIWVGGRAVLVSNGSNAEKSHASAGVVSVHHLLPDGDGFRVDGEWLRVATDDYGEPPEWRITDELTGRPALRVDNGGGNQGIFCNFTTWYDLAGGRPSELARVQTGYTNEGEEGGFELEGRIANLRPGRSFEVVYTGYESFTERYRWRGDRFEKEGGETRVPQC